jgi:hypothetical protein
MWKIFSDQRNSLEKNIAKIPPQVLNASFKSL